MSELISVRFECPASYGYAAYYSLCKAIDSVIISNNTDRDILGIEIELSSLPSFFDPLKINIGTLRAISHIRIDDPKLDVNADMLAFMKETTHTKITAKVKYDGHEYSVSAGTELMTLSGWSGIGTFPELMASLSMPECSDIQRLGDYALRHAESRSPAFGYKNKQSSEIIDEFKAVYNAVQALKITYSASLFICDKSLTKLKLPDEVLSGTSANSLELALVFVSVLEAMKLNPLIVLTNGKTMVGCFLEKKCFASSVCDNFTVFNEYVRSEINMDGILLLIDPSSVINGTSISFESSVEMAVRSLNQDSFYLAVDFRRAHLSGVKSLPQELRADTPELKDDFFKIKQIPVEAHQISITDAVSYLSGSSSIIISESPILNLTDKNSFRIIPSSAVSMISAMSGSGSSDILSAPYDSDLTILDSDALKLLSQKLGQSNKSPSAFFCFDNPEEMSSKLFSMISTVERAKSNGSCENFYAAFIEIGYYDSSIGKSLNAPLLFIPVKIYALPDHRGFCITVKSTRVFINTCLIERLSLLYGVKLSALKSYENKPIDQIISFITEEARSLTIFFSTISVSEPEAFIGVFPVFDMRIAESLTPEVLKDGGQTNMTACKIAISAAENVSAVCAEEGKDEPDADAVYKSESVPPLSLDKYQLSAMRASETNAFTVVKGPSGSGKTFLSASMAYMRAAKGEKILYINETERGRKKFAEYLRLFSAGSFSYDLCAQKPVSEPALSKDLPDPDEIYSLYHRSREARLKVNSYYEAMNTPLGFGYSFKNALLQFDKVCNAKYSIPFAFESIASLDKSGAVKLFELAARVIDASVETGGPYGNPLCFCRLNSFSYELKNEIISSFIKLRSDANMLIRIQNELAKLFQIDGIHTVSQAKALFETASVITKTGFPPYYGYFDSVSDGAVISQIPTVIEYGKRAAELRKSVMKRFDNGIFSLNSAEMLSEIRAASSLNIFRKNAVSKDTVTKLRTYAISPKDITVSNISEILNSLIKYSEYAKYLSEHTQTIKKLFGKDADAPDTDLFALFDSIEADYSSFKALDDMLLRIFNDSSSGRKYMAKLLKSLSDPNEFSSFCALFSSFSDAESSFEGSFDNFSRLLKIDSYSFNEALKADYFDRLIPTLDSIHERFDSLKQWSAWIAAKEVAESCGQTALVKLCESADISRDELSDAFTKGFFRAACEYAMSYFKPLRDFSKESYRSLCTEARRLSEEADLIKLASINKRLCLELSSAPTSEAGNITSRFAIFVSDCESAYSIITEEHNINFNCVIFDDAHLIPTFRALMLFRHTGCVCVIGNSICPKSPQTLFRMNSLSACETDVTRLSMLSEAAEAAVDIKYILHNVPEINYETKILSDIISGSNMSSFYPLPYKIPSISSISVKGEFDPINEINREEASAAVNSLFGMIKTATDKGKKLSCGIYTLSEAQARLIKKLIIQKTNNSDQAQIMPDLSVLSEDENIFVRCVYGCNFETRDHIIFSPAVSGRDRGKYNDRLIKASGYFDDPNSAFILSSLVSCARISFKAVLSFDRTVFDIDGSVCTGYKPYARLFSELLNAQACPEQKMSSSCVSEKKTNFLLRLEKFLTDKGFVVSGGRKDGCCSVDIIVTRPGVSSATLGIILDDTSFSYGKSFYFREVTAVDAQEAQGIKTFRIYDADRFENENNVFESVAEAMK
ncbi:MAG: DUF4011 domain-containing protein [Oscillospiraceae bacterium]|nr:DUF4011 domain-containing protein [Oscillospiraceae bacterium]